MPNLATLPELLVPIFASASVPTVLTCERVCKQWSIIIRSGFVEQVWKPKFVQAYPEDCVPVMRGNENWRDVALVWFAWWNPWKPEWEEPTVLGEVGRGESLRRKEANVVRDLTNAFESGKGGPALLGSFISGEVLCIESPRDGNRKVKVDGVFNDSQTNQTFRPAHMGHWVHGHGHYSPQHVRTDFVACWSNGSKTNMCHFQTGHVLANVRVFHLRCPTVCGNFMVDVSFGVPSSVFVTSLRNSSIRFKYKDCQAVAFNETILAYAIKSNNPDCTLSIHLVRLANQTRIFTYNAPKWRHGTTCTIHYIRMSRFNLFLACTAPRYLKEWIEVLDFHGNHLYDIRTRHNYQIKSSCLWDADGTDWDRELVMLAKKGESFTVFDPIEGTKTLHLLGGGMGELEGGEGEVCEMKQGYSFTVMEYPTDSEGKRTGARGVLKCYRRSWVDEMASGN
ncbi:hypothetical protein HDV00_010825 [Rhizophlyctis rosea]|nr:hypothetical protein HDV00_010825 [Rhizophlyctis rosea]